MDQSFPDLDESEQFFENAMEITQNMENENHELVENGNDEEIALFNPAMPPPILHQCITCQKIFKTFGELVQHSALHSNEKPFKCQCGKSFRFKSNYYQHKKIHEGFTPYKCSLCEKTTRLKFNMKSHMRSHHAANDEELQRIWNEYLTNNPGKNKRKSEPVEVPPNAIIVQSEGERLFKKSTRPKKKFKLGLGRTPKKWITKIHDGRIMGTLPLAEKLQYVEDRSYGTTLDEVFEMAKAIPFEQYDCPECHAHFLSRYECTVHIDDVHPEVKESPLFCEVCKRMFNDDKAMEQHQSYHERVRMMLANDLQVDAPAMVDLNEPNEDSIDI